MNGLQIIFKSIRPITLTFGIASVAAGCAAAAIYGYIALTPSLLCLIFAIFAQSAGNITHRYYDEKYGLGKNLRDGMSFEDEDGRPVIYLLKEGVRTFTIFTVTCGAAIFMVSGWWTIIPALLILAINWLNNKANQPWSNGILYPLVTFTLFGPLCVISTFLVNITFLHIKLESWQELYPAFVLAIVMGLMALNGNVIQRAANSLLGLKGYKTFTDKYGIRTTSIILLVSSIIYSTVLALAPIEMRIYFARTFLILPTISFIASCISIYLLYTGKNPYNAWIISMFNLLLVGISVFIIFWYGGFPLMSEIDSIDIPNLL